jgi:phage N-6-adenine-methyltransferase
VPIKDGLRPLMGSDGTEVGTPLGFFEKVDDIFGFDLDVCATEENAKVDKYISPKDDAFLTPWIVEGKTLICAWMNPPYGRGEKKCLFPFDKCGKKKCEKRGYHITEDIPGVGDWIRRAIQQAEENGTTVVALLPSRTDTEWFQEVFSYARSICFVRGRIKFIGSKDVAPFPSVLSVFSKVDLNDVIYDGLSELGNVIDPREGQILVYGGAV